MEDTVMLRQRAEGHRVIARTTHDLWESVIRYTLASSYDQLAMRRERPSRTSEDKAASLAPVG